MSIQVQCEHCGAKRKVNERLAGRTIRCPGCEQALTIPKPAPVASATPVARNAQNELASDEAMEVEPVYIPDPVSSTSVVNGSAVTASSANGRVASGKMTSDRGIPGAGTAVATPPSVAMAPRIDTPEPIKKDDEDDDLVPPRKKREDGELDMTPMVDVTFLLLIFFMVTASFSLQKSIQMPRQSSDLPSMSNVEEETEELDPVELEIDESGAFLVLAPEWERETPGKQNLITALKESIGDNRDGMKLDIKVHENAKLQMLVDGMDAGTIAGFTQIQVTEVDGFD
ncbi:biopolymer transporter ExbD [Neorhodopirellula pilleata]|uniref:Biopolymer transport protein ExbD/TolR n=1 Tax=Neorhodopirellula pilleata TaxID=2714738 RepID=A0A5C6AN91_9BACT|nr:biopolymer transporter ExbD [Neorhodopirellula pilleata]TWU01475.1 Biopolymer transport protein ExbD/TolR [Neorhodopirellula pilleata]